MSCCMGQDSTIDTFKFRAPLMHPDTVPVLCVWFCSSQEAFFTHSSLKLDLSDRWQIGVSTGKFLVSERSLELHTR